MSSAAVVVMFVLSIVGQIIGIILLPASRGFTAPLATAGCVAGFTFGVALSARIVHSGVRLSTLTPIGTVALQFCAIAIGVLIYGDSASPLRLGMLVAAGAMIGLSTMVG